MNGLLQDVRYALRQLRRSPRFVAVTIIAVALGIGLNSGMLGAVKSVISRERPVDQSRQLVQPAVVQPNRSQDNLSSHEIEDIRDHDQSLSGAFAFDTTRFLASVNGQTDHLLGQCVSANFFSVLGVRPALGRALTLQDDQSGQPPVVVISYDYWKRRFALDPGILNNSIVIKKISFQVVGVAPRSFHGVELGDAVDVWMPMVYWPQVRPGNHLTVGIMGRRKPGATIAQSFAELRVLDRSYV